MLKLYYNFVLKLYKIYAKVILLFYFKKPNKIVCNLR